jgi:putative tryptophan/tyrosine transport system substrate-binding protein
MRRREFVAAAAACLVPASRSGAQPARPRRIGVVLVGGPHFAGLAGLREGLQAAGLQEGASLVLEVRGGTGDYRDVQTGATELERQGVDVLVAFSTSAALAAQRATADVPIVFAAGSDPVAFRLVESIARPGGRLTGVHTVIADSTAKRFELLREIVPNLRRVVSFYNPTNASPSGAAKTARETAKAFGVEFVEKHVHSPEELRASLAGLSPSEADAIFFVNDAMVLSQDKLVVQTAIARRMATMAYELDLVANGALAGYGLNYREFGRLAARYVIRILEGASPRDLPVEAVRPALAINLKTARALGLTIPLTVQAQANEVIE